MGSKKKEAQAARREARKAMAGFQKGLSLRLSIIDHALRPRPRWFPRFLWNWIAGKFLDIDAIGRALDIK